MRRGSRQNHQTTYHQRKVEVCPDGTSTGMAYLYTLMTF
jgi:hypothetical protein